jgi:hypothetical protein
MTGAEYLHRRFQRLIGELEKLGGEVEFDAEDPWRLCATPPPSWSVGYSAAQ